MRSATAGDAENDRINPQVTKKATIDRSTLSTVHHQRAIMFRLVRAKDNSIVVSLYQSQKSD